MAFRDPYRDPFVTQYAQPPNNQPRYAEPAPAPEYNPYVRPYQPYDQRDSQDSNSDYPRYRDKPVPSVPGYHSLEASQPTLVSNDMAAEPAEAGSGYDYMAAQPKQERSARALARYRHDVQGDLWRKGGRGRCLCRFCCCSIFVTLFLFISILLSLVLWTRPPNINIGGVSPVSGQPISASADGVSVTLGVAISVDNPNFFSVAFKNIRADIVYPINNTNIGGGTEGSITFPAHTSTSFTFPFTISYKRALDPDNKILVDLATKCGILGSKSDITVNYKITLGLRILFVTISPVVENSFSFTCPLSSDDLSGLLSGAGISVPSF